MLRYLPTVHTYRSLRKALILRVLELILASPPISVPADDMNQQELLGDKALEASSHRRLNEELTSGTQGPGKRS